MAKVAPPQKLADQMNALPAAHPKHSKRDYQGTQDHLDVKVPQDGPLYPKEPKQHEHYHEAYGTQKNAQDVHYDPQQEQHLTVDAEQYDPPVTNHQCCPASTEATDAADS